MVHENNADVPSVRMRSRADESATNTISRVNDALNDLSVSEETAEIKKLDSQLDHMNDYMNKLEERLKTHNEKLMETIKQQKEARAERRKSFMERMDQLKTEEEEHSKNMRSILRRVESVKSSNPLQNKRSD